MKELCSRQHNPYSSWTPSSQSQCRPRSASCLSSHSATIPLAALRVWPHSRNPTRRHSPCAPARLRTAGACRKPSASHPAAPPRPVACTGRLQLAADGALSIGGGVPRPVPRRLAPLGRRPRRLPARRRRPRRRAGGGAGMGSFSPVTTRAFPPSEMNPVHFRTDNILFYPKGNISAFRCGRRCHPPARTAKAAPGCGLRSISAER